MTAADPIASLNLGDATTLETLREMARDMQVALYRRYDTKEAVKILDVSEAELEALRVRGKIAYLLIGQDHVAFFGCQLLTYLLHCVVPAGATPEPREAVQPEPEPAKPVIHPEAELLSVKDTMGLLGIGRTKLYAMLKANELDCVKIGTRTLIKRTSIQRITHSPLDPSCSPLFTPPRAKYRYGSKYGLKSSTPARPYKNSLKTTSYDDFLSAIADSLSANSKALCRSVQGFLNWRLVACQNVACQNPLELSP